MRCNPWRDYLRPLRLTVSRIHAIVFVYIVVALRRKLPNGRAEYMPMAGEETLRP
jgi:hypothetical protein